MKGEGCVDRAILTEPQFRTLRNQVTDMLREAIISGQLKPGERLVEGELAERMSLSRSPVREALRELEKERLIKTIPNKGTTVVEYTREDVVQIFGIRVALEQLAVRWAIQQMTAETMAALEQIVDQMEAAAGPGESMNLDTLFHRTLHRATRAERLIETLDGLMNHVRILTSYSGRWDTEAGSETLIREHRELLAYLAAGQTEPAVQLITRHVEAAQERILERLPAF